MSNESQGTTITQLKMSDNPIIAQLRTEHETIWKTNQCSTDLISLNGNGKTGSKMDLLKCECRGT